MQIKKITGISAFVLASVLSVPGCSLFEQAGTTRTNADITIKDTAVVVKDTVPTKAIEPIKVETPVAKVKNNEAIGDVEFIKSKIRYNSAYPFIKYNQNYIEYKSTSEAKRLFDALTKAHENKVRIIHIGDSHVQADIFTGYIRNQLQGIFGIGGRGFFFPYAAAKTHNAADFISQAYGSWVDAKNLVWNPGLDLGITGVTIRTENENSGFKVNFKKDLNWSDEHILKIYVKKSPSSFDVQLFVNGLTKPLIIKTNENLDVPYIQAKIPSTCESIEVGLVKSDTSQHFFECNGLLLEAADNSGVEYNSVGINGASLKSILRENLFKAEVAEMKPELVVLDLGTNDIFYGSISKADIEADLSSIVSNIREASPNTTILLCNVQSINRRNFEVKEAKQYAEIVRDFAFANNCLFYDYFNVSGGLASMQQWGPNGLAQNDRVHLTGAGYNLRGDLFVNALLNSYCNYLKGNSNPLIVEDKSYEPYTVPKDIPSNAVTNVVDGTKTFHKVKQGENLFKISQIYGVTVADIKKWNNLSDESLIIGNSLLIFSKSGINSNITSNTKFESSKAEHEPQPATQTRGAIIHTVKAGDSMFGIATAYGVTIREIMIWNNMYSGNIYPGNKLSIFPRNNYTQNNANNGAQNKAAQPAGTRINYVVRPGDNLGTIAAFYGVTINEIQSWNGLYGSNIVAGNAIVVYARLNVGKTPQQVANQQAQADTKGNKNNNSNAKKGSTYVVKKGDTLTGIASSFGVSVADLQKWNGISGAKISIGQVLTVKK